MERIINEVTEKLKSKFREFFAGKDTDIAAAEAYFSSRIAEATLELLRCYYEKMDRELREDKAGRKRAGITVERRGDKREILLLLGPLEYRRTYYKKASGGYEYPVDRLAGVEAYERKMLGVSAIEKKLGRKDFRNLLGDLVIRQEGKPTLAPEDDKRPEMNLASVDFAIKDDGDDAEE